MKPNVNHAPEILRFAFGATAVGKVLAVISAKGLCALHWMDHGANGFVRGLQERFPNAELEHDPAALAPVLKQIDRVLAGELPAARMKLDLRGPEFFQRVWRAMLKLPRGRTWSYAELARRAGRPRAVRAAASACARNPVGLVVPCHRIVGRDGLGGYGCGLERKRLLLRREGVNL